MNEITRKAANALVAAVDFFQGALLAEAQAGEAKQTRLDALAGQLRDQSNEVAIAQKNNETCLEDAYRELAALRRDTQALREVAMRARVLLPLKPGTKAYEKARGFLARDLKALDG